MRILYFILIVASVMACNDGEPDGLAQCSKQADCADVSTACAKCPEMADQLCANGACVDREEDAISVYANINIEPRQLVVESLVHALVAAETADGDFSCDQHIFEGQIKTGVNTLAAGFKSLSGGSYHQNVNVGRVPEGDLALILLGTDEYGGTGNVIAVGCEDGLVASSDDLTIELVDLVALE
jgi:hypothetical protein